LEIANLTTQLRKGTGKSYTRKARGRGWIPAVYYGHNRDSQNIEVNEKELGAFLRAYGTSQLVDLQIEGEDKSIAIIKEIQRDVLKPGTLFHVDFQHVDMAEKINVQVPIIITGTAIGVKNGGVLSHSVQTVTVECLPINIPESIEIDVSKLDIGDAIHIRDIQSENYTFKDNPDEILANVTAATQETAEVAEDAEGAEDAIKDE